MPDQLMFVQFPHPGAEHIAPGPKMPWNKGAHARKFLKAHGRYLAEGALREGLFSFWGEWEPQSRVVETFAPARRGWPRALHEPYWQVPSHLRSLQNTDPLVFGDRFLYSNCRQGHNSKLRSLAPGSVILFGSKLEGQFALDTVFVVGDRSQMFTRGSSPSLDVPGWVQEVVFGPLRSSAKSQDEAFRLYRARMYEESSGGPFSFVPCRPYGRNGSAFTRPPIRLNDKWISPNLAMGAKATPASHRDLRAIWTDVVNQVAEFSGLALGTHLRVPPRAPDTA